MLTAADDMVVMRTAADGAEAAELARDSAPHVVLMDLSMPNMDGVEATSTSS